MPSIGTDATDHVSFLYAIAQDTEQSPYDDGRQPVKNSRRGME